MSEPKRRSEDPSFQDQPPVPEVWPLGHPRKSKDRFCTLGSDNIQINLGAGAGEGAFA